MLPVLHVASSKTMESGDSVFKRHLRCKLEHTFTIFSQLYSFSESHHNLIYCGMSSRSIFVMILHTSYAPWDSRIHLMTMSTITASISWTIYFVIQVAHLLNGRQCLYPSKIGTFLPSILIAEQLN